MLFRKKIYKYAFGDNDVEDINLGNTDYLRAVILHFKGTLTASGGAADGALIQDALPNTIFKKLTLTANGRDEFYSTRGKYEYWRRWMLSGSPGVLVSTMPTGEAATAQEVQVVLDMDSIRSSARWAGRINAAALRNLNLRIETGDGSDGDIVTGGDRAEVTAGDIEVIGEWDDSPVEFRGGGKRTGMIRRTTAAATDDGRIALPSGLLYRQILLLAIDNGVRDDDIIDEVKVTLGEGRVMRESSFEAVQSDNVEDYGLELSSGKWPLTGVAMLNFDLDYDLDPRKLLNTLGRKDEAARLVLKLNSPTGTSYVEAVYNAIDRRGVGR